MWVGVGGCGWVSVHEVGCCRPETSTDMAMRTITSLRAMVQGRLRRRIIPEIMIFQARARCSRLPSQRRFFITCAHTRVCVCARA